MDTIKLDKHRDPVGNTTPSVADQYPNPAELGVPANPLDHIGVDHAPLPGVNLTDIIEHTHDAAHAEAMTNPRAHITRANKGASHPH